MSLQKQAEKLHEYLLGVQKTLALSESCTGGLLSATICALPGASKYYLGAAITYAGSAKKNILGVKASTIACLGEVSVPTAVEMARGARRLFASDYSIAITGIAGPSGGTPDKPVGTVCFAVSGPGLENYTTQKFSGSRQEIQLSSAEFALKFLWDSIHK
jgi:PncC family amidohydrolase